MTDFKALEQFGDFVDFVSGKSIAVVGPAATLRNQKMGSMIDGHDLVVRLNHSWPLPKHLRDDIGTRVDIIYHNMNFRYQRMDEKEIAKMHRDGVTWLVSTHPASEVRFKDRLRSFLQINQGVLKFRALEGSLKKRMQKRVNHPNAGLMAMEDLLQFPIKTLYVTGFSFYTTGYLEYPNYRPSYAKKAVRHHDQNQNKSYFLRLMKDERVHVDPWINQILQKHADRKKRRKH